LFTIVVDLTALYPESFEQFNGDTSSKSSVRALKSNVLIFSDEGLSPSDTADIAGGVERLSLEVVTRRDEEGVDIVPDPNPSKPLSRLSPFEDDPEELRPFVTKQPSIVSTKAFGSLFILSFLLE
jgi:hypothetical protein